MSANYKARTAAKWLGIGTGVAAAGYATSVALTWCRYGYANREDKDRDLELDRFMPIYDAVERHRARVVAPAEITFSAACDLNIQKSTIVRALFKSREFILGGEPQETASPQGLIAQAKTWGWGVLAESAGAWIIFGGVTQPWVANPVFRALPPGEFAAFQEPGYVKIAWTLRVDPVETAISMARTETRVVTTDAVSRVKFRRYWACLLPGMKWIRRIALNLVKAEAERRAKLEGVK